MGSEGTRRIGSSASGRRGVGGRGVFWTFEGRNGEKGVNWRKIYVLLWSEMRTGRFFCVLEVNRDATGNRCESEIFLF